MISQNLPYPFLKIYLILLNWEILSRRIEGRYKGWGINTYFNCFRFGLVLWLNFVFGLFWFHTLVENLTSKKLIVVKLAGSCFYWFQLTLDQTQEKRPTGLTWLTIGKKNATMWYGSTAEISDPHQQKHKSQAFMFDCFHAEEYTAGMCYSEHSIPLTYQSLAGR